MSMPAPAAQVKMEHTDPWKEDGNIVLIAEGKGFRVHRTVLSAYSDVFKDMFHCPAPVDEDFIENCPVVHLQDAANDVQIMLKAMYDRSYPSPHCEKMTFSVVSAFLRLGEKYAIPVFVKEAKAKLCCNCDATTLATASFLTPFSTKTLFPEIMDCDPHDFQIMNLLQEVGLKAALPIAMYQCTLACPLKAVVHGYQANASLYSLSPANLRSFILMKDVLENYRMQLVKVLRTSTSCIYSGCCAIDIHRLWLGDTNVAMPPLGRWQPQWDKLFCEACGKNLKAMREVEMNKTWNQMPSAFGFHSWEEARKSSNLSSC